MFHLNMSIVCIEIFLLEYDIKEVVAFSIHAFNHINKLITSRGCYDLFDEHKRQTKQLLNMGNYIPGPQVCTISLRDNALLSGWYSCSLEMPDIYCCPWWWNKHHQRDPIFSEALQIVGIVGSSLAHNTVVYNWYRNMPKTYWETDLITQYSFIMKSWKFIQAVGYRAYDFFEWQLKIKCNHSWWIHQCLDSFSWSS